MSIKSILIASIVVASTTANLHPRETYEAKFIEHIKEYNLEIKDGKEFVKVLQIYSDNLDIIENHNNKKGETWTAGSNQFTHLSPQEFKAYVKSGGFNYDKVKSHVKKYNSTPLVIPQDKLPILNHPKYKDANLTFNWLDWQILGGVNTPMNQGSCGSSWAFAATGNLETAYFKKYFSLPKFSEQMLISCDTAAMACNGDGNLDDAIEWVQSNGGIATESNYPYASATSNVPTCDTAKTLKSNSAPKYIYNVAPSNDVNAMKTYLNYNTISIGIEADQQSFQYYSSGVITGSQNCGTNLDQAALNVGYGTLNGIDYWKVKNSWGTTWGQNGYVLIERSSANVCGVLTLGTIATNYKVN